jgi:hypothetical protein
MTSKLMASLTLLIGSVVAIVTNIQFASLVERGMVILAIVGVIVGFRYTRLFLNAYVETNLFSRLYDEIYLGILEGELRTASEISDDKNRLYEATKGRMKLLANHQKYYDCLLSGESK